MIVVVRVQRRDLINRFQSEQTLKIFLLKWKRKKFHQFSSNKFSFDIGTSWNFLIKHIVDLNKFTLQTFAFSPLSRLGRNAQKKRLYNSWVVRFFRVKDDILSTNRLSSLPIRLSSVVSPQSPAVLKKTEPKTEPESKNFKFTNRSQSRNRELKNNRTGIGIVGTEKLFDDN